MTREFNRNMFVMLAAVMIGVIIITFFVADIKARSEEEEKYTMEIASIEQKNINFTNNFMKSSVLLDKAREDRAFGNYHFDLGFLWYQSALAEINSSIMDIYKVRGIDNCTNALPYFYNSYLNFEESKKYFINTRLLTDHSDYIEVLDLYINLTASGSRLTMLRYNASIYLNYLTENLTFNIENNNVTYLMNVSDLLGLFMGAMGAYGMELEDYEEYQDEIDEYEFFDEIR